jgi:hypothetical protein
MTQFKIKYFFPVLFGMIFPIKSGFIEAQNLEQSLASMRGVSKAGLIIENVSQVLHDNGINEDDIRKDVLGKLDSAGITVLPNSEMHNLHGSPYLYINIGAVKSKQEDLYAISLSVEFRQDVNLSRNPKQKYYGAATWSVSDVGIFSTDKLKELREYAKGMVEKFIMDYLKANKMEETK